MSLSTVIFIFLSTWLLNIITSLYLFRYDMKTLNCSFNTVGVEYTYYYTRLSVVIIDTVATCISYSADSCFLPHKGIRLIQEGLAGIKRLLCIWLYRCSS